MGRFSNDFAHTMNRSEWKFKYSGSDLLEYARLVYEAWKKLELESREDMSRLLNSTGQIDRERQDKLSKVIQNAGTEREKCSVWVHEFARNPDVVYELDVSDVCYFNIAPYDI